jgi:hypothetical protein
MPLDKKTMLELVDLLKKELVGEVVKAVIGAIKSEILVGKGAGKSDKSQKSAYSKTESLLYNYKGFQRIVQERMEEIENLRKYGVPQSCGNVTERVQSTPVQVGLVLPEESVENAVRTVEASVQDTVRVIALIDKCMAALVNDPYYKVLEMRYFEGRTLEDIGAYFGCDHSTISRNRSRLVNELAMRIFPDEVIKEYIG